MSINIEINRLNIKEDSAYKEYVKIIKIYR